ncbi:MAG: hypothetical protein QXG03_11775, partial [Halalkalicoccus sp.]
GVEPTAAEIEATTAMPEDVESPAEELIEHIQSAELVEGHETTERERETATAVAEEPNDRA